MKSLKHAFLLTLCMVPFFLAGNPENNKKKEQRIRYKVDITQPETDLFRVTVLANNLSAANDIYNIPCIVPGTYSISDFGRFVTGFHAFDKKDRELKTEKISTGRWKISNPKKVARLEYTVEDTFDSESEGGRISPMCGTGMEPSFVLLNTFGVLGFFEGMQSEPVELTIAHKPGWIIGTALIPDENGIFYAESYDRLADSPFLTGNLTVDSTKVNGINVKIFVYCQTESLNASSIREVANHTLQAAGDFSGFDPVPNYAFLFCLLNKDEYAKNRLQASGALEHSYSSVYTLRSENLTLSDIRDIMAHEFMHILTPLNLSSEVIQPFNFMIPTPSEHIWLYEGVTEWVSEIMQLRSGQIAPGEFMDRISSKMNKAGRFEENYSLSAMSLECYTPRGQQAFPNYYQLGSLTATLLDLRLLELSEGKKGLRELFLELVHVYGKDHPFPEKDFFDTLVAHSYPEIRSFIDMYIRDSQPLPLAEYFEKIGFRYIPQKPSSSKRATMDAGITLNENKEFIAAGVGLQAKGCGLKNGDIYLKLNGEAITMDNARELGMKTMQSPVGTGITIVVKRDGKEITIQSKMFPRMDYHLFEEIEHLTPEQQAFRKAWSSYL